MICSYASKKIIIGIKMKIHSLIRLKHLVTILLFIVLFAGCTQNPGKKIEKGIELYISGETAKAITLIEDGLVNSALINKIKVNQLSFGENVLFYRQKKNLRIIWPLELNIEISEKYNLISYFPEANKLGLSNGYDIKLYDSAGNLIKTCGPTPDDKRIKAFTLINELIYYYKDKKVFIYDPAGDTEKQLSNVKTQLLFDNESYDAKFYKTDNSLVAVAGIAGRYYLSIYDLKNNSVILANYEIASLKLLFRNDDIYYVSGSAGNYTIIKKSIAAKKQKNLMEFKNLKDIEFFASEILFEDKEGLWFAGYESSRQKIPFRYELAGQCGGNPVIKYANNYYVTDVIRFADSLNQIKEKAPIVFDIK